MEIKVYTTFWGPLKQDKFFVDMIKGSGTVTYRGDYQAGEWSFVLFDENGAPILKSEKQKLERKKVFLGNERYKVLWEDKELAVLNKSWFKKTITYKGMELRLPGVSKHDLPELNLRFPISSILYRRKIKGFCESRDPQNIMMSIVTAVFLWFTWNALNAD